MRQLTGTDRVAIADELIAGYDTVAAGGGPLVVSLEGPLGFGKTRLVQELYERLAASHQGPVRYWPVTLDWTNADGTARPDLLQARKVVEPTPGWVIPGRTEIPWLWWAISCQLSHAGNPMRAMKDASEQLRVHLDPIQQRLAKTTRDRDDALELLGGLFDLAGVVNPGSFLDAGQTVLGVFRRRIRQAFTVDVTAMDRRVETHDESYAEAARVATGLTEVARAGIPVILIVDDAQWADPGLVSLLRYLADGEASRILIVTTTWADHDRTGREPAESFGAWLESVTASRPDRVRRVALAPLADDALGEMLLSLAPRTDPDSVRRIAALATGNPLVLNLLLDLDLVRQDIAPDGRIDTDPERLRRMPSNLQAIYQDLWRQLPTAVQRVLVLVSVQGQEFLPGFVERASERLAMHDELMPALAAARDRYHWIRSVNDDRWEFSEPQRYRIAFDHLNEVFAPEQLDLIHGAIVEHVVGLKASPGWASLDTRTRRVALESHTEDLGEAIESDPAALADSSLQLAALELDAGDPGRAVELVESAIAGMDTSTATAELDWARNLLAQGLIAAGRAAEAVPMLAAVGAEEAAPEVLAAAEAEATLEATSTASGGAEVDEWGRIPWTGWTARSIEALTSMAPSDLGVLVWEVAQVEGPVYAGRVYDQLRAASGAARQSKTLRAALDAGVRAAVRRGQLVASPPEARGRPERRLLRLADQPEVLLRTMGERQPDDVPRREIAELARRVAAREGGLDRVALKRRVGALLGQKLMTKTLDELLEAAIPEVLGGEAAGADTPATTPLDEWGRLPWAGWTPAPIPALASLKPAEIGQWIQAVVAAEGPVVAGRVFGLVSRASGAPRLSSSVLDALESGLASAVRRGDIIVVPGRRGAPETRTLRLPSQPEAVPRLPGDRAPADMPKAELADLAARVTAVHPDWDRSAVKREVARLIGIGRYTDATDQLLEWAIG